MKLKIRISRKELFYFFSALVLIQPAYFQYISFINRMYTYGRLLYMLFLLLIVMYKGFGKTSKTFRMLLVVESWVLFNTILHGENVSSLLYEVSSFLGIACAFELGSRTGIKNVVNAFYYVLYIYIVVNLITLVIYPSGMYSTMGGDGVTVYWQNWFLGYKNYPIRLYIPTLALAHIQSYIYGKFSVGKYLLYGICWYSIFLLDSSTALVGMAVFTIGILFIYHFEHIRKLLNVYTVTILILLLFFIVVVAQQSNPLSILITDYFGKDLTFTGRTVIWSGSIPAFVKSPLWGYGQFSSNQFQRISGTVAFHPHNYFLYILIRGGLIELLLTIAMFASMFVTQRKYKNNVLVKVSLLFLGCMLVMGLTESIITTAILFYPMSIVFSEMDKIELASREMAHMYQSGHKKLLCPK